jgi:hypothetical protein
MIRLLRRRIGHNLSNAEHGKQRHKQRNQFLNKCRHIITPFGDDPVLI